MQKKEYKQMKLHLNYILVPCKLLRNQIYKIMLGICLSIYFYDWNFWPVRSLFW